MKIFIIEDDSVIANLISDALQEWGYECVLANEFSNIVEQFAKENPQLILLDVKLPFHNGFYWCQEIRKISSIPIIFISSNNENMNMVLAMNMGADDYICKPFDMSILVAKIQAMLRRTYAFSNKHSIIEHHDLVLMLEECALSYHGEKIELTKNEVKIMELLLKNKGCPVSKKHLMIKLWDNDYFVSDNTLLANIARLRKKLEQHGVKNLIITKKGIGYMVAK